MELKQFVEQELSVLIKLEPNKFGELLSLLQPDLLSLADTFDKAGITESIRPKVIDNFIGVLHRLLNNSLIAPLTGEDDEWTAIKQKGKKTIYVNKRMPTVYKSKEGAAFFDEAIVFFDKEENIPFRGTIGGVSSTMGIKKFPFIPRSFIIEVFKQPYNREKNGDRPDMILKDDKVFIYVIKNKNVLLQANKYYNILK